MDALLERDVRLSTESKYKNLYDWWLTDTDEENPNPGDIWIPFDHNLWFTAANLELHTIVSTAREWGINEAKPPPVYQKSVISGKLISGICRDGYIQDKVRFSMFGTSRELDDIHVSIYEVEEGEAECCKLYATPSFEYEGDEFQSMVTSDHCGFDVRISKHKLDSLTSLIKSKSVARIELRVSCVEGIYSNWSPTIVTRTAKVLSRDHRVLNKEAVTFEVPCTGKVQEFELTFSAKQDLYGLQFDNDEAQDFDTLVRESPLANEHRYIEENKSARSLEPLIKEIRIVKLLLWAMLVALVLMLLR